MSENIKVRWLVDNEQTKIAPKTFSSQILNEDGTHFKDTVEASITEIDEKIVAHSNNSDIHVTAEEKEGYATKEYVENLYTKLNSNTVLGFYCIEDVTIITNGISKVYPANSNVEVTFIEDDVFEIIPTSDSSILSLTAFPGALGTFYTWLEGVALFSNILFDMNDEAMYSKWSQGNQGTYHVQSAQYTNCIFWSDNPYISDVSKRTNYTLTHTSQLPLCYSTIPDNTFKSFYLAGGVNSDPNWSNQAYKDSFAKANWATQVFSYYGARTVGLPGMFDIVLPKDCRGLMFDARNIENAGTFNAINTTNFGAKSGSWREAFGDCTSLRRLYIKNLKVSLNISWSPIDYNSISYIISSAANTNAITISVSPYTYNLLSQSDFELATSKNITIALLTGNYVEDRRLSAIADKADKSYVDNQIANLVNSAPATLDTLGELATAFNENKEVVDALNEGIVNKQNKLSGVEGQIVGFDGDGNAIAQDNPQPDWNQNDETAPDYIKNKPIISIGGDTLIWDGNTDGLASVMDAAYRVSGATPAIDDFTNGAYLYLEAGPDSFGVNITSESIVELVAGVFIVGEYCFVVYDEGVGVDIGGFSFPESGIYFVSAEGNYVSILTIYGYTGFAQEKIAPSHLYQPDWNQSDAKASDFIKNKPIVCQPDYNQTDKTQPDFIKNREFGEFADGSDTLTWDGNTEGRDTYTYVSGHNLALVCDSAFPAIDESYTVTARIKRESGETTDICTASLNDGNSFILGSDSQLIGIIVFEDNHRLGSDVLKKGVYLTYGSSGLEQFLVSSLTISGYTGFPSVKKLDKKYLYQPDWNQTDSSAPDFIKNRTHYIGTELKTEVLQDTKEVTWDKGNYDFGDVATLNICPTIGSKYIVTFNGTPYECVAWTNPYYSPTDDLHHTYIGNGSLFGIDGYGDSNVPFLMGVYNFDEPYLWDIRDDSTGFSPSDFTVKIEAYVEVEKYYPIDKNYLPMDDIFNEIMSRIPRAEEASF